MAKVIPEIDLEKCTGCGECAEQCPEVAVAVVEGKATVVRPDDCNYCAECEGLCPSGAISCPFEIVLLESETPR